VNRKTKIILVILTTLFVARQFYTLSDYYIKQHGWLHGEGYCFTDFFPFDKNNNIKNDTIFRNRTPVAIILHRGYRPLIPNYLVIKSLNTNEVGTYHEK